MSVGGDEVGREEVSYFCSFDTPEIKINQFKKFKLV